MFGKKKNKSALEFPTGLDWINSDALTLKELRGKVVLLDFWTYSCVNCQRTLPALKSWHKKYAKKGLVIIGIHTPEFDFEKKKENVQEAISKSELEYPIVLDPDYKIWNLYKNHWWPRKILINNNGEIIHDHIGEGSYAETEREIQKALREIGAKSLPEIYEEESGSGGVCLPVTPETYLGFERGRVANHGELEKNQMHEYKKTKLRDYPTLEGNWKVEKEFIESGGGVLYLPFRAGEVNVVMELAENSESKFVGVSINGKPLDRKEIGDDVSYSGDATVVEVANSRLYKVLLSDKHKDEATKFDVPKGIRLYAFTFGASCN